MSAPGAADPAPIPRSEDPDANFYKQMTGQVGAEGLSVRTELQADCYAGVWASTVYKKGDLDEGDIEEAFGAARAVGDDRLQKEQTRTVRPDTFTHGTSRQRRAWFDRGYRSADPGDCDAFSASHL